jgi:hypothetical protein
MKSPTLKTAFLTVLASSLCWLSAMAQTTVLSANAPANPQQVIVVYSGPMDPVSSGAPANYSLAPTSGGSAISVTGATLLPDQVTVQLTLASSLQFATNYTLTIRNVKDASAKPLPSPTTVSFTYSVVVVATYTFDDGATPPDGTDQLGNALTSTLVGGGAGGVVASSGGYTNSGMLVLTTTASGDWAGWTVPDLSQGNLITSLDVSFKLVFAGPDPGQGISISWAPDAIVDTALANEHSGYGSGLIVELDSAVGDNGQAVGYTIKYGGNDGFLYTIATVRGIQPCIVDANPSFADAMDVHFSLNAAGIFNMTTNGVPVAFSSAAGVSTNVIIPGWAGIQGGLVAIAADNNSAGGSAKWVDNVVIAESASVGPVGLASPPANQIVLQGRQATFGVVPTGAQPWTFQWYSNNVAIADATNINYVTPPCLLANNGDHYKVAVSNSFSGLISPSATLTVMADTNIVNAVSVGSLDGNSIGVLFDKPIDLASGGNPANYTVSGATVTSVSVRTNIANYGDPTINYAPSYRKTVRLNLDRTLIGSYTVTVSSNVLSLTLVGRSYNTTLAGSVAGLRSGDIGTPGVDPLSPGESFCGASNLLEVVGSGDKYGSSTGNNPDYGQQAYYPPRTDDFDIAADCYFMTQTAGNAKAGMFVRPDVTDINSAMMTLKVLPSYLEGDWRATQGAQVTLWNVGPYHPPNNPGANWLRFKRVGTMYTAYYSTNGVNWTLESLNNADTNAFPVAEYVGFFACAANNDGRLCEADFANFGPVSFPLAGITITSGLLPNYTNHQGSVQTFSIAASMTNSSLPAGELSYQWQRAEPNAPTVFNSIMDGTGNGPTYATPALDVAADNDAKYRVIAFVGDIISGNSATSAVATLHVLPPGAATLVSVFADPSTLELTVNFDEPMDPSSSQNPANYTLTPVGGGAPIAINSAVLSAKGTTVMLTLASPLSPGAKYTFGVNNVYDSFMVSALHVSQTVTAWELAYGFLKYERWFGAGYPSGTGNYSALVEDLLANPNFPALGSGNPDSPDLTELITYSGYPNGDISNPTLNLNDFGARISGYFMPPATSSYQWYVRGNDGVALYVSPDSNRADMQLVASIDLSYVSPGWSWFYSVSSGPPINGAFPVTNAIPMTASQPYYLEAIEKQQNASSFLEFTYGTDGATVLGGGSVNDLPGGAYPVGAAPSRGGAPTNSYNIGGMNIATYASPDLSTFTASGPTNTTASAGATATFAASAAAVVSVGTASAPAPVTYQWMKNGSTIIGATNSSYSTPLLTLADSNSLFSVVMSVPGVSFLGSLTNSATLNVAPPQTPPALQLRLPFADAPGSTTTPSDTALGSINVTMNMTSNGTVACDLHGALGTAPNGQVRALDMTATTVPSQDGTQPGNNQGNGPAVFLASSPALAALGQSGTISNFVVTFWMNSVGGLYNGNGPRLLILGPGAPGANAYNGSGVFSIRYYGAASVPNNELALWFGGGSDIIFGLPFNVPTNQWLFVAMAWDGLNQPVAYWGTPTNPVSAMSLVSGNLAAGSALPMGAAPSLVIGNQGNNWQRSLNGKLADMRFYTGGTVNSNFIESVRMAGTTLLKPVNITAQPLSQPVAVGSSATFSVTATGDQLSYQWYSNSVAIAGATSSSYTTAPATPANNGDQYYVVVSNPVGSVPSSAAQLLVNAIGYVQSANYFSGTASGTNAAATLPSTANAGDLIVVWVRFGAVPCTASVSDTLGNTWTPVSDAMVSDSTHGANKGAGAQMFYTINQATGSDTINVTYSASVPRRCIIASEYTGVASSNPLDGEVHALDTTSTSVSVGPLTTSNTRDLLFACSMSDSGDAGPWTPGSGYTLRQSDLRDAAEDMVVSTTGSYSASFSASGGASFVSQLAAFKAAAQSPIFTGISRSGNTLTVNFTGSASALLWTTNLQTPLSNWMIYQANPTSPVTITTTNSGAFFRLKQ